MLLLVSSVKLVRGSHWIVHTSSCQSTFYWMDTKPWSKSFESKYLILRVYHITSCSQLYYHWDFLLQTPFWLNRSVDSFSSSTLHVCGWPLRTNIHVANVHVLRDRQVLFGLQTTYFYVCAIQQVCLQLRLFYLYERINSPTIDFLSPLLNFKNKNQPGTKHQARCPLLTSNIIHKYLLPRKNLRDM